MMSKTARSRRILALAAAYVIGLQALLLPLSVATGGSFSLNLCAAATSVDSRSLPVRHDTGCLCAAACGAQCFIQTLAESPQVIVVLDPARWVVVTPSPAIALVIQPAARNPQIPRAPPAA